MTTSGGAVTTVRRRLRTVRLVLARSVGEFLRDRGPDQAGSLTFYGVLSLFPAILVMVSLLGVFGQGARTVDAIMAMLSDIAPPEVLDPIRGPIESLVIAPAAGTALVIGMVVGLLTASRYVWALGRVMNGVFGIEEGRPLWRLLLIGILLTALLIVLVAVGGLALVFTGPVAQTVGGWIGLGETALAVWGVAKWPAALVSAVLALAVLYRFAPNVAGRKFHWVSLGAAGALVVIGAATAGFGFFVSNFGDFNRAYGSLAGIIVFLLWLWMVNMAVLFGVRLDAEVMRVRQLRAGIHAEEAVQVIPRDTKASEFHSRRRERMLAAYRELRREPADDGAAPDSPEPDGPGPESPEADGPGPDSPEPDGSDPGSAGSTSAGQTAEAARPRR
ncbi:MULTISPECIES: YihY/virulence factor BrkB family protein [unclassified Dietzia]|uniref:YihY/virulence factor BrkB family protein n=2 Tax=Dietzia TaxID=37914 RepID=UPI0015F9433E|nr:MULTISPECIES: YihY/virulence factor BrkB family protein [unclassified Dietzia]MBB1040121.1 YihY family inner membrane protein [Dietzia sp. Cai40]MBB1045138.1 YihY family inner membrane protein [Dietzia sp. DQ11-44]MBB1052399.1 YihY family inner membrane protein [Dietzia sp. CW19]MBC7296138.1 YihY family inner membrane protein [Dietzia sp.]